LLPCLDEKQNKQKYKENSCVCYFSISVTDSAPSRCNQTTRLQQSSRCTGMWNFLRTNFYLRL
jgi:hypothetical protein